jgi:hypothetical protein
LRPTSSGVPRSPSRHALILLALGETEVPSPEVLERIRQVLLAFKRQR